jgi:O-methyltransferase involved in polyketide biosynthesis
MRKSQSSMTATGIAIVRAIESEKPGADRICYDPYARRSSMADCFISCASSIGWGTAKSAARASWAF